MTIDELVDRMRGPIFVLTLAKHDAEAPAQYGLRESRVRGAKTRADNARSKIHGLVMEYAKSYDR